MKPSYNIQLYEVTEAEFNTSEIVLKKNQLIRFGNSHKLGNGSTKIKDIPVWGGVSPDSEGLQWSDTSMLPSAGKVPVFSTQGLLSTGMPLFPENAVNLAYLNATTQEFLGVFDSESALNTAHPTGTINQFAHVRDVDSTGDIHRYYYWGEMAEAWLHLNKADDDTYANAESRTNKIWVDGKNVYRRVLHDIEVVDDSSVMVSLAGVGIADITRFDYTVNENGQIRKSVNTLDVAVSNTSLTITPTGAPSVPTSVSVILEYTK